LTENQGVMRDSKVPKGIDAKLTERYLLGLSEVLDASVWWSEGELNAHVTVSDDSELDKRSLQAACLFDLGVHQTPRSVELVARRSRAA